MKSTAAKIALVAAALALLEAAAASPALAQSSITVERRGGGAIPQRLTVDLVDGGGFRRGRARVEWPGMLLPAVAGRVPEAVVERLAEVAAKADLACQPAEAWTGAMPDGASRTFKDEDGSFCTLRPAAGSDAVEAGPAMRDLAAAMAAAERAFVRAGPPRPLVRYELARAGKGRLTLTIDTEGACRLRGAGAGYASVDQVGALAPAALASLSSYLGDRPAAPRAPLAETIAGARPGRLACLDAHGALRPVARPAGASAGWTYVARFLESEMRALDPSAR